MGTLLKTESQCPLIMYWEIKKILVLKYNLFIYESYKMYANQMYKDY